MGNLGRYQEIIEDAHKAGGVDIWLETIKKASYQEGAAEMKSRLVIPLLAAGAGLSAICVIGGQKIHDWITEKKQGHLVTTQEAVEAEEYLKRELLEAINEIDISNEGKT